jgi:hypothetical protein
MTPRCDCCDAPALDGVDVPIVISGLPRAFRLCPPCAEKARTGIEVAETLLGRRSWSVADEPE